MWKQKYVDWIQDLSEIIGLKNLTHLKVLDLSNNRISTVKELIHLKNLADLRIARNKIKDVENLKYFKEMPSLKYLDISGNKIVKEIQNYDFGNIEVKLEQLFFKRILSVI